MNKEKQIEEMAKIICTPTANKGNCEKCGFKKHCSKFDDATDLYNAGYRKASEVAREICEEIRKGSSICLATQNGVELYHTKSYTIMGMELDEIEKKYTEGE